MLSPTRVLGSSMGYACSDQRMVEPQQVSWDEDVSNHVDTQAEFAERVSWKNEACHSGHHGRVATVRNSSVASRQGGHADS